MTPPDRQDSSWAHVPGGQLATVARNVGTRYLAIATETLIGLLMSKRCRRSR